IGHHDVRTAAKHEHRHAFGARPCERARHARDVPRLDEVTGRPADTERRHRRKRHLFAKTVEDQGFTLTRAPAMKPSSIASTYPTNSWYPSAATVPVGRFREKSSSNAGAPAAVVLMVRAASRRGSLILTAAGDFTTSVEPGSSTRRCT